MQTARRRQRFCLSRMIPDRVRNKLFRRGGILLWIMRSKFRAMSDFALDARLAADTIPIGDLALCTVLLMNDARFPWLISVPRRAGVSELTDLSEADATVLMQEICMAARVVTDLASPTSSMSARSATSSRSCTCTWSAGSSPIQAWPGPVWGHGSRTPYPEHAAAALIERAAGPPPPDRTIPKASHVRYRFRHQPAAAPQRRAQLGPGRTLRRRSEGLPRSSRAVPILRRNGAAHAGLLPLADLDRVSPLEEQAFLGSLQGARPSGRR